MAGTKTTKGLSAAFVRSVATPGRYHDAKGMGLFLWVKPSGTKSWVQRITVRGHRRDMGLGGYPIVTLAEARELALENKRVAAAGGNPMAEREKARGVLTFEEAARKAHAENAGALKNPKDRAAYLKSMETYVFPSFGSAPLPEVTSSDVRRAIMQAGEKAPGVARKLVYRVSSVFKWGIAEGICTGNPSTAESLALPKFERNATHRKALPYSEVKGCIEAIQRSGAGLATKLALEFLVLTACRSGEVRLALWKEIDLGTATWELPVERMKMKRVHRVPLSPRAVEILNDAKSLRGAGELVFPGTKPGRPLSDMTLSKLVRELGFDASVHGFRTSFRTWAQERSSAPREVAEAALAHRTGDAVEQAYARSDLFEKRRRLMNSWAAYLATDEEKIVRIG